MGKRILMLFLLLLSVVLVACGGKKVTKISADKTEITLTVGKKETITVTVEPKDTDEKVAWSTNNPSIAKVVNGEVEAVAKGTAEITATAGDKKVVIKVTVVNVKRTVTFLVNGGSAVPAQDVEDGSKLSAVTTTRARYAFVGWFIDSSLTMPFNMETAVTSDLVLHAKWEQTAVAVTFDTMGGSPIAVVNLEAGEKVARPANPSKEGYSFGGWYEEAAYTTAFNFNKSVNQDVTVYAKWNPVKYSVSFEVNGGTAVDAIQVQWGTKLVAPTVPTRVGYTFGGWYTDVELTTEYNFDTLVKGIFILYAKWVPSEVNYTVKYYKFNVETQVFDLVNEVTLKAITGEDVTVIPEEDPVLVPEQESYTAVVLADGSLVIEVKYVVSAITFTLKLNGGNFTYQTREEMVDDFFKDYNTFGATSYTRENLPMGSWSPVNFSTFFFDARFRDKWLWMADYLSVVGSSANKSGCLAAVTAADEAAFNKLASDHKYRVSYEVRGFIMGVPFTSNANFKSSDYSDYALANGFWDTFAKHNEVTSYVDLAEPFTLPTEIYKEGYDFGGWYTKPDFSGEPITVVVRQYTLYAKWNPKNPVTEIKVNNGVSTLEKLATLQLDIEVLPANAFNKAVAFITSDITVLKVSDTGLITAVNTGTAKITIESVTGTATAELEITVYSLDSLDVTFSEGYNGTLEVGKEAQVTSVGFGGLANKDLQYKSSNASVLTIDAEGKFKAIAKGTAQIEISLKDSTDAILTVSVSVVEQPTSSRIDQLLALLYQANQSSVEGMNFRLFYDDGTANQQFYQSGYSSVNLFLFDELNLDATNHLVDPKSNKSSGLKPSTEFIVVHDTANLSGGLAGHASYWKTPGVSTSIHFTVGDYGVVQSLDTAYSAHHAGDGTSVPFAWHDTGVSAVVGEIPVIDISLDGFFTINGTKSGIKAPTGKNGEILDKTYFSELGPSWTVINGKYHLGTTYLNTSQVARGAISNYGGNMNSTGIEMCVNTSGDIYDTWQRTAKLVAMLLLEHDLELDRVKQHSTFSGKNCPQSLRASSYWKNFIEMVDIEREVQENYADATITMVSNNPTLVNNTGRVIARPATTQAVSYTITVKIGEESKSITLGSVIPGITTWNQTDGYFKIR